MERAFPFDRIYHDSLENQVIVHIPVNQIKEENPLHYRFLPFDPLKNPKDEELVNNIREQGMMILQEIMVQRLATEDGQDVEYRIIFGHRRVAAARHLKLATIPAVVVETDQELFHLGLVENSGRAAISCYEQAVAIERLRKEHPELTDTAIASSIGMSKQHFNHLKHALNESSPVLLQLWWESRMDVIIILDLQEVFEKLTEEEQVEVSKLIVKGMNRNQSRELKNLVKQKVPAVQAAKWVLHKSLSAFKEQARANLFQLIDTEEVSEKVPPKNSTHDQPDDTKSSEDKILTRHEKIECLQMQTGIAFHKAAYIVDQAGEKNIPLEIFLAACIAVINALRLNLLSQQPAGSLQIQPTKKLFTG